MHVMAKESVRSHTVVYRQATQHSANICAALIRAGTMGCATPMRTGASVAGRQMNTEYIFES